jgi:hypothetical protein
VKYKELKIDAFWKHLLTKAMAQKGAALLPMITMKLVRLVKMFK